MDLTFTIEEQFNITKDPKEIRPLTVTKNGAVYDGGTVDGKQIGYSPVEVKIERSLKRAFDLKKSLDSFFSSLTCETFVGIIEYEDTSNVTDMGSMFDNCPALTEVPLFDTSNVTKMSYMFNKCQALTEVPLFDTSNVTNMGFMFRGCQALTEVPLFDTSNVTNMGSMFKDCQALTEVPLLDTRSVTNMGSMFSGCQALTECWIKNITVNLQVGSGTSYGHLLTLESLIHLIRELRNASYSKTLTVGSANLTKLAGLYVRTIDITDEMRAEDDLIDEKLPFEVCESTDEGAKFYQDYMALKNWQIK